MHKKLANYLLCFLGQKYCFLSETVESLKLWIQLLLNFGYLQKSIYLGRGALAWYEVVAVF